MPYEVKLDIFEGPLDLLLHLIHRNEVSITDIPIALITRQYLDTIELMKSLNLDVAGEYLVMASYLTHIKSQMLLPTPEQDEGEPPAEDPRAELVAHLLEYKRYKDAAEGLAARPVLDRDVFAREDHEANIGISMEQRPLDVSLRDLILAFRDLLARTARRDLLEIEPDRLSIKDKIHEILSRLKEVDSVTFQSLFPVDPDRREILVTFLALLEIVKLRLVSVYQDKPFGTILVSRRVPVENDSSPAPDILNFV